MTDSDLNLSRRKALGALGTIGAASAGVGFGTSAFFSDGESFENNSLIAGSLDVKAEFSAHYSDWSDDEDGSTTTEPDDDVSVRMYDGPAETTGNVDDLQEGETGIPANDAWLVAVDDPDQFLANTRTKADGNASCSDGTDADELDQPVIDLEDVKPGDFGAVTIDFTLCDNPGFVWLNGSRISAAENGRTESERDDPDEGDGVELLDTVRAAAWIDDSDGYQDREEELVFADSLRNVLERLPETGRPTGAANASNAGLVGNIPAEEGGGRGRNCFSAETTHSVTFAWYVPTDHSNEIQTDSVTFDLGLYTEQCRHNRATGQQPATSQIIVSNSLGGRPGFNTIQDALDGTNPQNGADGAEAGDTILVETGTFEETVTVTEPNITLIGSGRDATTVTGQISAVAPGFELESMTVRAAPGVTDSTAVSVDDGTGLGIRGNRIIARDGGVALNVKRAPETGTATIVNNTFESLGNTTAESLVVIGTVGSVGTSPKLVTDGGQRLPFDPRPSQLQEPQQQPLLEIIGNEFTGNVNSNAVSIAVESNVTVSVANNNFSDITLFSATPGEDVMEQLVSNQSSGQATVTVANNTSPSPTADEDEGISIPGTGIVQTADLTDDGNLPGLTASQVADSLVPSAEGDGFFLGAYVPTVTDPDGNPENAYDEGVVNEEGDVDDPAAIAMPTGFRSIRGGYRVTLPIELVWNSTVSASEFGNVEVWISNDEFDANGTFVVPSEKQPVVLDGPRGRQHIEIEIEYEGVASDVPADNLFRDADMKLRVYFEAGSRLAEITGGSLGSTLAYVTPNNTLINRIPDVLNDVETAYSEGLSAAEEVTRLPDNSTSKLRKFARITAFAVAAASDRRIARSELAQNAAVNGLSAFGEKAREIANKPQFFDPNDRITPAGPTVAQVTDPENVEITNVSFSGDRRSGGAFEIGPQFPLIGQLKVANGAILGTGQINDIQGPNSRSNNTTATSGGSDSDLEALPTIDNPTNDRAVLEFDLDVPKQVTAVSFEYIFGSEEYNEFTGSTFNDVYAFFVNGENVATVPDPNGMGTIPASINNINHGQQGQTSPTNPQLFINNDPHDGDSAVINPLLQPSIGIGFDPGSTSPGGEPFPTEMDGFTMPLQAIAQVNPGELNHVKIAIADVGDTSYDSWVLISARGITTQNGG